MIYNIIKGNYYAVALSSKELSYLKITPDPPAPNSLRKRGYGRGGYGGGRGGGGYGGGGYGGGRGGGGRGGGGGGYGGAG